VEIVDQDLLSQIPQKDEESLEERGRRKAQEGQQWRCISCSRTLKHLRKKTPFIALKEN
jgi:hypothetical protein